MLSQSRRRTVLIESYRSFIKVYRSHPDSATGIIGLHHLKQTDGKRLFQCYNKSRCKKREWHLQEVDMILYFSATGNTKYIATELAKALGDNVLDLRERIRQKDYSPIRSKKPFILCSPVYVCEPPLFLIAFLRKTKLIGSPDVYSVFTSGGYAGISEFIVRCLMRKKHYKGSAEIKMPRNYIASNMYPELETAEIERRIRQAGRKIQETADVIRAGDHLKSRHIRLWEILVTLPFNPVWYHLEQGVKDFHVKDNCISCGKCERLCPLQVISMDNGKPVWKGKTCAHCMSCIQNCPAAAIEYGEKTKGKKRYYFEKYRYALDK